MNDGKYILFGEAIAEVLLGLNRKGFGFEVLRQRDGSTCAFISPCYVKQSEDLRKLRSSSVEFQRKNSLDWIEKIEGERD